MNAALQFNQAKPVMGEVIPIRPKMADAAAFPTNALSRTLQAAVGAIVAKAQVPEAMAASSVLAVAALAVQTHVDVMLPTGTSVPTSLYFVSIAGSSSRKSEADRLATSAIKKREFEMADSDRQVRDQFRDDHAAWTGARKKAQAGTKDRNQIRRELEACGAEPVAPPLPLLTAGDATMQGLLKLLADAWPSLGLFSDEGGVILGGFALSEDQRVQTGAVLSQLWGGQPVKRIRAGEEFKLITGRRLSMHLMVQPRVARKLFGDPHLKDQGLLSRVLPCEPASLVGTRIWKEAPEDADAALADFEAKVLNLLRARPLEMDDLTRALKPVIVPLGAEARQLAIEWFDQCELASAKGGALADVTGFAGKMMEMACRLAAVMACFEAGKAVEISHRAMAAGVALAKFYLGEAMRLIGAGDIDQDSELAATLIEWIRERKLVVVGKQYLSRNGPQICRGSTNLTRAIAGCEAAGHLHRVQGGAVMDGTPKHYREAYTVAPEDDA